MIRINCTQCKSTLDIDEAFAGGVCRCQHCGTIQTVPKHLKTAVSTSPTPMPAANSGNGKSFDHYGTKSNPMGSKTSGSHASGLDELADVVASSGGLSHGLTGSGLQNRRNMRGPTRELPAPSASPIDPAKTKLVPMILIIGLAIVLMLGVIIGILINNNKSNSTAENQPNTGSRSTGLTSTNTNTNPNPTIQPKQVQAPAKPKPITGPQIFNTPLIDESVVYLIDRGAASQPVFDLMVKACSNSIVKLSAAQRYQVVFWKLDSDKEAFAVPKKMVQAGDKAQISKLESDLGMISCYGESSIKSAMDKAIYSNPAAIVILTPKTTDDAFVKQVMGSRKENTTRIYCFSINNPNSKSAMEEVARKTGGVYKNVTPEELQSAAR